MGCYKNGIDVIEILFVKITNEDLCDILKLLHRCT